MDERANQTDQWWSKMIKTPVHCSYATELAITPIQTLYFFCIECGEVLQCDYEIVKKQPLSVEVKDLVE